MMPYGYAPRGYGYAPFNPARVGAMVPYGYGQTFIGADPATDTSLTTKIKEGLDAETIPGIANKWVLLGAAAVGLTWTAYAKGWF